MAKQNFTVGQVLTAAQLLDLQQTALGGGSATTKTASYVLVAADAGTTVAMTSTSATTITVNTGLFAAGDTVFIQNLGSGNLTITAGTATVNTAGSLILPQYDAGILYFVSASSAIFYDYIQVGATSPLTTKGDLYTFSTSDTRLGVGANGTTLTADSTEATGLKWAAAAGGGANWSLLNSGGTALTSAQTITISGISGKDKIAILFKGASSANAYSNIGFRINGDTGSVYVNFGSSYGFGSSYSKDNFTAEEGGASNLILCGNMSSGTDSRVTGALFMTGCNASGVKVYQSFSGVASGSGNAQNPYNLGGYYDTASTISSVSMYSSTGNFDNGTVYVYASA